MDQRTTLRAGWTGTPDDAVAEPEEPPQRGARALVPQPLPLSDYFDPAARPAFVYDWQARLDSVSPFSHPKMRFDSYHIYRDRLVDAVEMLNATPDVDTAFAVKCVLRAFARLRKARHDQNTFNLEDGKGRNAYALKGEDMEALLKLTASVKEGSLVRRMLEEKWMRETLGRYNARDAEQLLRDMRNGWVRSIPGSIQAVLYERAGRQCEIRYTAPHGLERGLTVVR